MTPKKNIDSRTVAGFGYEWTRFDQSELSENEHRELFDNYFSLFPWEVLAEDAQGFDLGCGSGRWAKLVAPRVGHLYCIDPSSALDVARKNLSHLSNCDFYNAAVDAIPLQDSSMDFCYSLGVLHHVPDTEAGIKACVDKLKVGAPFLIYLYYAFDNRPWWFIAIWHLSDGLRKVISRLPNGLRFFASQIVAFLIYLPLAKTSRLLENIGVNVNNFPLSGYRNCSFYTMRTDALDRLGTRLEKRFKKKQILSMMEKAGLERIQFSENMPFWCAVGFRK
jgi:ubiquinone/menaquinone biosynthesis C-methylase UbiE